MARDWSTRASSSMAMHRVVRSAPPPPYSSGKGMPNSPRSPIWRTTSVGNVCSASQRSAWGAISPRRSRAPAAQRLLLVGELGVHHRGWYGERPGLSLPRCRPWPSSRGRLLTGLVDVTSDLAALESAGTWAVVLPFDGPPVLARFASARPARPGRDRRGTAPARRLVVVARPGRVLRRGNGHPLGHRRRGRLPGQPDHRLSAPPAPRGPTLAALGAALGRGNPAPAAVVRLPSVGCHVASASPSASYGGTATRWRRRRSRARPPTPSLHLAQDRAGHDDRGPGAQRPGPGVRGVGLGGGARATRSSTTRAWCTWCRR